MSYLTLRDEIVLASPERVPEADITLMRRHSHRGEDKFSLPGRFFPSRFLTPSEQAGRGDR